MWEVQTAFERQNEIPFGILWLGKQLGFILDAGVSVCLDESKWCAGNHPSLVWTEGRECIKRTGVQFKSNLYPIKSDLHMFMVTAPSCLS